MAYESDWWRLAHTRKRVVEAGSSKAEAERDICHALADGKIKARPSFELIKNTILDHKLHSRYIREISKFVHDLYQGVHRYPEPWDLYKAFSVPQDLKPSDFDWRRSRFRKLWSVPVHPEMAPMDWEVSIALASADAIQVLIAPATSRATTAAFAEVAIRSTEKQKVRERSKPRRDGAKEALDAIFGNHIPDQSEVANKTLWALVNEYRTGRRLPELKPDSISRAAGRRKR